MCTNFALNKTPGAIALAGKLGVDPESFIYNNDFRPGSTISVVLEDVEGRHVQSATWWLYLQQTATGLKLHKDYFSVNTNYAKLPSKAEYRTSRCIIPATAFVESQSGRHPHLLETEDESAIGFGGLYKFWTDKITGDHVYSASIITLPGHPALENIHRKSVPLWLPESAYEDWLNPAITDTGHFEGLLEPALQTNLVATPIDRASTKIPTGDPALVSAK